MKSRRPSRVVVQLPTKSSQQKEEEQHLALRTACYNVAEMVFSQAGHLTQHFYRIQTNASENGGVQAWWQAFSESLASKFRLGRVKSATALLMKRLNFARDQRDATESLTQESWVACIYAPKDTAFREYLRLLTPSGPTVAPSACATFAWLRENVGVASYPLDPSLICGYAKAPINHIAAQLPALELPAFDKLRVLASGHNSTVAILARCVLKQAASSLRHAHACRAQLREDRGGPGYEVRFVSRGKGRGGEVFWFPVPMYHALLTLVLLDHLRENCVTSLVTKQIPLSSQTLLGLYATWAPQLSSKRHRCRCRGRIS